MIIFCICNPLQCAICAFEEICNGNEKWSDYSMVQFAPATKEQLIDRLKDNKGTKRNKTISNVLKYKLGENQNEKY